MGISVFHGVVYVEVDTSKGPLESRSCVGVHILLTPASRPAARDSARFSGLKTSALFR